MAQNPLIQRYLDAGMAFTQMTQSRAEAIVKDLVRTGEVQAQRTEELVNQLVERSRRNTDKLLEVVRKEVRDQIASLGLATKDDVARLERKLDDQAGGSSGSASKRTTGKKSTGKKSTSKKRASTKSTRAGKKTTAGSKKAAAKKSAS